MLDPESYPVRCPGVVGRLLEPDDRGEREAVLVLTEQSQVKVLNEVGARIWSLIDGTHSLREIARLLSQEYTVDTVQAERDVVDFVSQLVDKQVVTLSGSPMGEG